MVRLAQPDELYAVVERNLGNGRLSVKCIDGETRLCEIRSKFSGKKKEQVKLGSWILVGLRTFETKKNKCDLLETYNDRDVEDLLKTDGNWMVFGIEPTILEADDVQTTKVELSVINIDDI